MESANEFILLTGASSGIGRQLAIKLSNDYNLILHGRDENRLKETERSCSAKSRILIWIMDLQMVDDIEKDLSCFISSNNIRIAHFVHCAGYFKLLPLKMQSTDFINTTFSVNVISALMVTKTLTLRKINDKSLRSAVFISSNISNFGSKALSVYAASKGALDSLMRCLAVELAPDIRINSVLPGAIQTEMTENIFENREVADRMMNTYPLGFGKPQDIYEMVNFLISERARWITGQQFTVDGGRTINLTG